MASGSQTMTTYYAKRIIGDTAAANASTALLLTGTNIATNTWILNRTNRMSTYGIKYLFDNTTNGTADKIEFYGGLLENNADVPSAWILLDTGDLYVLGNVGIGHDPDTYKLYVNGTGFFSGFLTVRVNGESGIEICDGKHYNNNTFRAVLDLNPDNGNHGIWSSGYLNGNTFTSDGKWLLVRSSDGSVLMNGNASTATQVYVTNTDLPSSGSVSYYINFSDSITSGNQDIRNTAMLYLWRNTTSNYLNIGNNSGVIGAITLWNSGFNFDIATTTLNAARSAKLPNASGWIAIGGNGSSTGVGGLYAPVYLSTTGVLTEITAGTTGLFYRGDKTWSNTLGGTFTANGTITANGGYLISTANSNTVTIGSQNAGFTHIYNSADIPFIMNNHLMCTGNNHYLGQAGASYRWYRLYLGGATADSKALDSGNPLIEFGNSDRSQRAQIVYTDYNNQGGSDSFTFVSNQSDLRVYAPKVHGAVWNDYAECRDTEDIEPGYCLMETESGIMKKCNKRMTPGCRIISDTYGMLIGETHTAKSPIAVAGRVLVYTKQNRNSYQLGMPVCAADDGTIDIMSLEEIINHPECIIGTVSEIPTYDIWYAGLYDEDTKRGRLEIPVNGRIWIYVK